MAALTPQNFDRLAKAMMERHHVGYSRAHEMLGELKLQLICGEEIHKSTALQAAVLTAINTGKRAFRGGVTISLPKNVPLHLPWPGSATLNQVTRDLGARESAAATADPTERSLVFGTATAGGESLRVICDGWRAGVLPANLDATFHVGPDFALGGIFAGAFAVARCFLSAAAISHRDVIEPTGFSLWRPDLSWLSAEAGGPPLQGLPAKLWLLGLGHLGQAYAWTLGLLPFCREKPATIYLQDFDVVEEGNLSAGLLCEFHNVGELKTRMCAAWMEKRGFHTRLIERLFDENTKRTGDEPRIALCGFDNPESRRLLEGAGFELVVESGLGASLDRFDRVVLHTFPDASTKARDLWANTPMEKTAIEPAMFGASEGGCGIVFQEIATKAISSSFTGACASALVIAEVLKAIHGGKRCEFVAIQLRDLDTPSKPYCEENYQLRVARSGLLSVDPRFQSPGLG